MTAAERTAMFAAVSRFPQRVLIGLVRAYRLLLSPWLGSACRFEPTCSAYALEALEHHGAVAGSGLTLYRLARCHPWCAGGADPVPAHRPALFTRFVDAASLCADPKPLSPSDKTSP